jgi:hypothetical protein
MAIKFLNSVNADSGVLYVDAANDRVGIGTTSPNAKIDVNISAVGEYAYFGSGSTRQLRLSSYNTTSDHAGHKINASSLNGEIILATGGTDAITVKNDQSLQFNSYGAGYLKSDASGNITVDSDTIEDTLDSVTDRGNTTTNNITVGNITSTSGVVTMGQNKIDGSSDNLKIMSDSESVSGSSTIEFSVDGSEKMRINHTGKVGIGTTSPQEELEVKSASFSTVAVNTDRNAAGENIGSFAFYGHNNAATPENLLYSRVMGSMTDVTDGSEDGDIYFQQIKDGSIGETFRVKSNGNVGIGTNSPIQKLHIHGGSTHSYLHFSNTDTGTTDSDGVDIGINTSEEAIIWQRENNIIKFGTNSTERMRIDSSGNVGIGVTSPLAKLDIDGGSGKPLKLTTTNNDAIEFRGASSSPFTFIGYNSRGFRFWDSSNSELFRIASNGDITLPKYGAGYLKTDANGLISVDSDTIEDTLDSVTTRGNTTSNAITVGGVDSNGGVTITRSGSNTQLKLKRTTSATGEFNIYTNSDSLYFQNVGQSTYPMVINSSGNVGIGATSPGSTLHVDGTVRFVNSGFAGFEAHNTNGTWESFIGTETGGGGNRYNSASSQHTFYNNSTAVMRIDSSGNVGIGTTSPSYKLDVNGDGRITGMTFTASGAARRISTHSAAGVLQLNGGTSASDGAFINIAGDSYSTGDYVDIYAGKTYFSGNVGIGSSTPNNFGFLERVLHISAGSASSTTLQQAGLVIQGSSDADDAVDFGYLAFTNYQSTLANDRVAEIRALRGGTVDKGELAFFTADGSTVAERMRLGSSGNFGINTASPSQKLDVNGTALIRNTIYLGDDIQHWGDGGTGMFFGTDTISFKNDGGSTRIHLQSGGNVGIGTASPSEKLHVSGNVRIEGDLTVNGSYTQIDTDVNTTEQWNVTNDGTGPAVTINQTGSQDIMDVQDDGTSVFYIEDGGNVGIGTTDPNDLLQVGDVLGGNSSLSIASGGTSSSTLYFRRSTTYDAYIQVDSNEDLLIGYNSANLGDNLKIISNTTNVATFDSSGSLQLSSYGSNSITGTPAYALAVDSSGNVIETSYIPSSSSTDFVAVAGDTMTGKLTISSSEDHLLIDNTASDGSARIRFKARSDRDAGPYIKSTARGSTSADSDIRIGDENGDIATFNGGKVGIGTTSPSVQLDIEDSGNVLIDLNTTTANANTTIRFQESGSNTATIGYDGTADGLVLANGGFTAGNGIFINGSNNVGIGTSSPGETLDVVGNVKSQYNGNNYSRLGQNSSGGYIQAYSGAVEKIMFRSYGDSFINGGNVGIGTTSPSNKLDVRGLTRLNALSLRGGADNYAHLSRFSWRDTNSSSSGSTWKKVCGVSVGTGNYSAVSVDVVHYYPNSNHGNSASLNKRYYSISFRRSSGTQDNQDDAIVYGLNPDFIRVVRTALGEFELQARANVDNRSYSVDITQTGGNSDAITMVENSSTNGNTTGTIYTAVASANTSMELPGNLLVGKNVGIGTTSPDAPLTVHSSTDPEIRFGYSSTQDHRIVWDSSKVYIHADPENANGNSAIGLGVDGTIGLYMDNSHEVGIGTTNPNTKLHVADNTSTGIIARIQNSSAGDESVLRFQALSSTSTQEYADIGLDPQAGSGALVFRNPYTSERMRIDSSGNVGIGTTSPSTSLHVVKDASWEVARFEADSYPTATVYSQAAAKYAQLNIYDTRINSEPTMELRADTPHFNIRLDDTGNVLTILDGGNVGIGTTSPGQKLQVNGTIYATSNFQTSGNSMLRKYSSAWTYPTHDVVYNGWTSSTGDYTYLKSAGNSDTNHGIAVVADNGFFVGRTNLETGAITDSATDPIDVVWLRINSSGNLQLPSYGAGYLKSDASGNITVDTDTIEDTLDSVTDRGNTTTNSISVGAITLTDDPASNNGTFVKVYEDEYKRMYVATLDFTFTAAGTYNFNLAFPNSGAFHYELTGVTGRNSNYRNFGTLKDSSYIYWETDEDFTHRAEGDVHLISNYGNGMYFSADTTAFATDGVTDSSQTGTATWSYFVVRYSIYLPDATTGSDGKWKLHLTTYGDTGSSVPQFVLA